jgi:hypothetical protein
LVHKLHHITFSHFLIHTRKQVSRYGWSLFANSGSCRICGVIRFMREENVLPTRQVCSRDDGDHQEWYPQAGKAWRCRIGKLSDKIFVPHLPIVLMKENDHTTVDGHGKDRA